MLKATFMMILSLTCFNLMAQDRTLTTESTSSLEQQISYRDSTTSLESSISSLESTSLTSPTIKEESLTTTKTVTTTTIDSTAITTTKDTSGTVTRPTNTYGTLADFSKNRASVTLSTPLGFEPTADVSELANKNFGVALGCWSCR